MRRELPEQGGAAGSGRPGGRLFFLVFFVALLASAALYRGLWENGFYKDDYHWLLVASQVAASPANFFQAEPVNAEVAIRLTQRAVMGLTWLVAGDSGAAHHAASLILHALASTLVFALLVELVGRMPGLSPRAGILVAAAGAAGFLVTHNHAMAVLWLAAQSGVLATSAVVALMLYLLRREDRLREPRVLAGALGIWLVALYSKNTVAGFPLVLLALAAIRLPGLRAPSRDWAFVGAGLLAVGAAHVGFTRLVLFGGRPDATAGQFAWSPTIADNLLGALLAPFVSAADFEYWTGDAVSWRLAAVSLVALILVLGRVLGVLRPVAWGLTWIVALALPVTLLDYRQYDAIQLTVTRYSYAPSVGAAFIGSSLLAGLLTRFPERRRVLALAAVLALVIFTAHHGERLQRRVAQLRKWGEANAQVLDWTLEHARKRLPEGTTIYATGWRMPEVFIDCAGQLWFAPEGYDLVGARDLERVAAGSGPPPWVAHFDAEGGRFGVLPLEQFLQLHRTD